MNETNSRKLRSEGWSVLFRSGRVIIGRKLGALHADGPRSTNVDRGAWMSRPMHEWDGVSYDESAELTAVEPVCYCSSFPDTGCDFCNGTRPISGK